MQWALYSGHLSIVDIIFRSQLTLPPQNLPLYSGHAQYWTFLARNLYTFYFGQCFTVSFKFSSIFVVLLFQPVQWPFQFHENVGIVILQEFPVRIHLYGSCVFQLQRCPKFNVTGIEIWIQSWRFLLHMDNHFSSTLRISTNRRNSIPVHFVDWLFHALQTLANQWLSNYHISMISSNILSLGSFFSQH